MLLSFTCLLCRKSIMLPCMSKRTYSITRPVKETRSRYDQLLVIWALPCTSRIPAGLLADVHTESAAFPVKTSGWHMPGAFRTITVTSSRGISTHFPILPGFPGHRLLDYYDEYETYCALFCRRGYYSICRDFWQFPLCALAGSATNNTWFFMPSAFPSNTFPAHAGARVP